MKIWICSVCECFRNVSFYFMGTEIFQFGPGKVRNDIKIWRKKHKFQIKICEGLAVLCAFISSSSLSQMKLNQFGLGSFSKISWSSRYCRWQVVVVNFDDCDVQHESRLSINVSHHHSQHSYKCRAHPRGNEPKGPGLPVGHVVVHHDPPPLALTGPGQPQLPGPWPAPPWRDLYSHRLGAWSPRPVRHRCHQAPCYPPSQASGGQWLEHVMSQNLHIYCAVWQTKHNLQSWRVVRMSMELNF